MIADDSAGCADYVDRGHAVDPSDGASIASTADDSTDERIADRVDDTAVAGNSCKWDAAVSGLVERFAAVADLVRTDTAGRKPDWEASFAERADSPPVPVAAEPVCSEYLAHSDAAALSDSAASLAGGDCVEWALRTWTPVACSAEEWNLRLRSR